MASAVSSLAVFGPSSVSALEARGIVGLAHSINITTTHTIYFLDYIESVGVGRRATYLSGGGLCAGLYYVTLYALVIHLIGIKSIIIITTWGYALIICHPRWRPVIT
jgi:hypothetical protein